MPIYRWHAHMETTEKEGMRDKTFESQNYGLWKGSVIHTHASSVVNACRSIKLDSDTHIKTRFNAQLGVLAMSTIMKDADNDQFFIK